MQGFFDLRSKEFSFLFPRENIWSGEGYGESCGTFENAQGWLVLGEKVNEVVFSNQSCIKDPEVCIIFLKMRKDEK